MCPVGKERLTGTYVSNGKGEADRYVSSDSSSLRGLEMLPDADLAGLPPALPDLSSAACGTSGAGLWGQQQHGLGESNRLLFITTMDGRLLLQRHFFK